jgi:hypothetical protein
MAKMMTKDTLRDLLNCYIQVEGYTGFQSIYSVLKQEYSGEFDHKVAREMIRQALRLER